MTSVLTNTGAMIALQALEATQTSLNETQNQISTGLKINSAKDNAAVWTVATTMKANVASLAQVSTSLGNADSILGTAVAGATQIASLVSQIRVQIASLTDTSSNPTATANNIKQLAAQIQSTIASSSFNGVNLLNADSATGNTFLAATNNDYTATGQGLSTTISTGALTNLGNANTPTNADVLNFNALMTFLSTGANAATVSATASTGTAFATAAALTGGALTAFQTANTTASSLDTALNSLDAFNSTVEASASALGSVQSGVESQQTFVNNLSTSLTTGIGNMVDADMTAESARLTALQTQQQLGVSALSIANQAPQAILKLFV
jgi:flagellin